jgi:hypothetical protein
MRVKPSSSKRVTKAAKAKAEFEEEKRKMTREFLEQQQQKSKQMEYELQMQIERLKQEMIMQQQQQQQQASPLVPVLDEEAKEDSLETMESSPAAAAAATAPSTPRSSATPVSGSSAASTISDSIAPSSTSASSSSSSSPIPLPAGWPSHLQHHVTLINLTADSEEWKRVDQMMVDGGMQNCKILAVQRICNKILWERYYKTRQSLMLKYGNGHLNNAESMGNEKLMWHGSRSAQPHLIYGGSDGFDVRMANHGMLSNGVYFSSQSSYSAQSYAHAISRSKQQLSWNRNTVYKPAVPPISTPRTAADGSTKLVPSKIPNGSFQIFLARVCLGTSWDHRKTGGHIHGRPPLRPFNCKGCDKVIDLEKLNLDMLKEVFALQHAGTAAAPGAKVEIEEEPEEEVKVAPTSKKRRRTATSWTPKKRRATSAKRKAATNTVAASAAAPAAPASSVAAPNLDAEMRDEPAIVEAQPVPSSPSKPLSFDQAPVHCPHCNLDLGTRAAILAHPYRYDSVVNDHMTAVYESGQAYPELLVTYQP